MTKKPKHNKTEGGHMARQAEQNPTAGKINRTPAPDAVSSPRSGGGQGYGANGPVGNSPRTDAPGKRVVSPLGSNLESSVEDKGALDRVIREGTARVDDSISGQLRTIADGNVPVAHGMARQQADYPGVAKAIPAGTKASDAEPARKP
jgi:hypothetical protein